MMTILAPRMLVSAMVTQHTEAKEQATAIVAQPLKWVRFA